MSNPAVQDALGHRNVLQTFGLVATNLVVIGGFGLYCLGALVWLVVLARADVSYAYPFLGLGFILTMLVGWCVG